MFDLPAWLQVVVVGLVLFGAVVRPRGVAVSLPAIERPSDDPLWQRFNAIRSILGNQSRRFADVDATLGVMVIFEVTVAFWVLDKALNATPPRTASIIVAALMAIPIFVAIASMRCLGGKESPKATEFLVALEQDEGRAVDEAIRETTADFAKNGENLKGKEIGVNVSLVLFAVLAVVELTWTRMIR